MADPVDAPDQSSNVSPPDARKWPSLLSSCCPINLKFIEVCYRVKTESKGNHGGSSGSLFRHRRSVEERTILNGVTGMASPGEILAILGPSGSGKSTLLNALAGRINSHGLKGTILANNQKLSKAVLRLIGFVTQDDVLYPHLTVRETLVYCSLLRLPLTLTKQEKISIAQSVISELGLVKCENTIIGNSFTRGVSAGERKRVSIAHEMLINPSLLILDEPTSGLDSTGAFRVVATLRALARKGKTIVASMHQPSSRVYQQFDSVLLLSDERCLYFGKGSEAMAYFESAGFSPSFPMNPADFMLDLANGACQLEGVGERDKAKSLMETLISSYNNLLAPKVKASCLGACTASTKENSFPEKHPTRNGARIGFSTWFNQFMVLMQRGFRERISESFNVLRVFQVIAAALLSGAIWWHSDFRDIQDRLGLLFFFSIFWGVFPSFNSAFAFPQERAIFLKERASGMYTLSSYFLARIVGDISMDLILPTMFLTITYWMTGLKPEPGAFLMTLICLLGYVLVSQGLGLALGAVIMDAKQASTIATVTMLLFVLTGGYYVHNMPSCLAWIKYISNTFYSYRLLINIQYGDGEKISILLGCHHKRSNNSKCSFVKEDVQRQIRSETSVGILILMFVGYRLIAYLALRRVKIR